MNVIISNDHQNELSNLDIDVIKSISGVYSATEVVEMFKNFFFNKMILDVTALKGYDDYLTYQKLVSELEADKIIFLLPEGSRLCSSNFLGHLISFGIYNFTTNLNGVNYLLKKPNTYQDVENIAKMSNISSSKETGAAVTRVNSSSSNDGVKIIGFRNVTDSAGATTFIFMLKKELSSIFGQNVIAVEIDRYDFPLFYEKGLFSIKAEDLENFLYEYSNSKIILVDLNDFSDDSFCDEVIYLVEPSSLKLNRLLRGQRSAFAELGDKRVMLNKSLLLNNDVFDFESESGVRVFYNMPPLDERKRNAIVSDFASKLGLLNSDGRNSGANKIFGLFRR